MIVNGPQTQIHQNQAYVIQDPGIGGAISDALGTVLAALQQSQENKYREEQLGIQRYNASVNSRQQDLADADAERQRLAALQLGGFLRDYVGGARGSAPPQPGNQIQAGPGAGYQVMPQPESPYLPQIGNTTQMGGGQVAQAGLVARQVPLVPGNIDLNNRPVVRNADGTISTVRSMSFNEDGREVLVPTVSDDGRILSDKQAVDQYHQTGKHLGVFANPQTATAYAQSLHNQQAQQYANGIPSSTTVPRRDPATQGSFEQMFAGAASALNPAGLDVFMQAALLGVDPENLPAAIAAAEKVQGLAPKQPDTPNPTPDMQNYATWAQLAGVDPRDPRALELLKRMISPAPGATVNVGGKPSAFDEKWGEGQALALGKLKEGANVSLGMFSTLHEAYSLVKGGKVITGFGAKQLLGLARFAKTMGAPIPDDFKLGKNAVVDTQTLLRLTGDQVLAYLRTRDLGSGTAVSDNDRLFMESMAGRDITLDKETLTRIMRINTGIGVMKAEEAIKEMREQALQNPGSAAKLNADAALIAKRLAPQKDAYLKMKAAELKAEDDIRKRAASLPGFVQ